MRGMSARRVGVASGLVVALTATTLTWFAVTSKGETVHRTDLNDGGVWVSSAKDGRFARVNKAVGQFDAGVVANSGAGEALDILQDDMAVAGLVSGSGALTPIDPRTGRLAEGAGASVPPPTVDTNQTVYVPRTVDLRGGTLAMVEPKTGKVWAQTYEPDSGIGSFEGLAPGTTPLATVGATAALAVDVEGNVHAVSGATGKVVTIPHTATGYGRPVTEQLKLRDAKVVDITAVGSRWVVYSAGDDKLFVQGRDEAVDAGTARQEGQPAYAALQQPGADADAVGLQDATTLKLVGLDGSTGGGGVQVELDGEAPPPVVSRPLRVGQCVYAAWASVTTNYYGKSCGSDEPQPASTIDRDAGVAVRSGVALRTNHGLVVLNDMDSGAVWDLDSKPVKLDEWDSLIPPPKTQKDKKNKDNLIDDTSATQPPQAKPDELQARPGRTSKLFVLDNDTDATGSVLAIAPGDVSQPDASDVTATVSGDGQSIDVTVPPNPDKQQFSFTYKVNNGKSPQKSSAKVTVRLVPDTVNTAPRLRPGTANLAKRTYPVNQGKLLPVQVLGDWRDPESDPLNLTAVDDGTSVDGLGRLNVLAPQEPGTVPVEYAVSDGRDQTKATLSVKVLDPDDQPVKPQTQPDVVRGVVGKPLQVEPLGNDLPGADPAEPDARLQLSRQISSTNALAVDTNLDTGVATITGSAPGTYELSYGAQVGAGVSAGRMRVDLIADPDPEAPPVAVPDSATVRDQTPVLTDVLANDYSPRADVLVTRSVQVSSDDDWLRPSIYQGRWVRIEAVEPAQGERPRTGSVSYTVSDGSRTATGQVSVTQLPANDKDLPIVQDDTAVVRAQDTVTIPVMDNDSMANGIPLVLDPASVKVLKGEDGADGEAFASGNVVRFVPTDRNPTAVQTATLEYAVYPIGQKDKSTTGRVAVTIQPLPTAGTPNQPPVARSFSTSVTAGDPLTITIPSTGVDPDGDSVTVTGLVGTDGGTVDLRYGRVTSFGASTIRYEAYPTSAGTEVLNYEVRDRFGATSSGFVRIGVVQPGDPQPPVAVPDEVRAKPGKTVTVDATQNDLIGRGDSVELEYKAPLNPEAELRKWKVDEANTYFTTTVPGAKAGVQHLTYGISNGLFDPSRSSISVVPDPNALNPPTAVDDTAKPKDGETTTLVDVLANDRDIDGPPESLSVTAVLSPDGVVEDGKVRVKVKDFPYSIPYVITDEDGLTAMALIHVPTGESGLPYVVSGALIEMDKDSTKEVELSDYVKSPRGRVVGITTADNLSASPRDNLRVEAIDQHGLRLTSSGGYVGPAAVMLEVSDQETVDQTDFRTAYVSIPVQVGPKIPLLRCPSYTIKLSAGGYPRAVDIPTLCHAWLPVGMTTDDVVFESSWKKEPRDVDLTRRGNGDRIVELRAGPKAPSSVDGRLSVRARGGAESVLNVEVLGLGDAVDANGNELPTLGPPTIRPFTVSGLEAGSSRKVDLHAYLDSPLERPDCAIASASAPASSGLTVTFSGCTLTVSASSTAHGTVPVSVVASDGPGRTAAGRGTVELLGKPGKPTGVSAEADRASGGFARVRWAPPAEDGGAPITAYVVKVLGPGGGEKRCTASPCTITGLTNGESYRFTVRAVNAVGEGPEGGPSRAVVPDSLPNPVNGVRMASRGDRTLRIAWSAPNQKGSPVEQYQVRVTDTSTGSVKQPVVSASQLQATVSGLTNDHQQRVQVRAKNKRGWGPPGTAVTMQSAGTPPAVPAPSVSNSGTGPAAGSSRLTIRWSAVRPNGPAMKSYTVYARKGSGAWKAIGTTNPSTRSLGYTTTYDGSKYQFVVTATNGAGKEGPKSKPSAPFDSTGVPQPPQSVKATTPSANYGATVVVKLGHSRSTKFTRLQWSSGGKTGYVTCNCANNAQFTFKLTGLGTSTQRVTVRALNAKTASSGTQSGQFQPFGPTKTPNNGKSSVSGKKVTFTWSLPTNGRPVTKVRINGTVYNSHKTSISFTGNYSQKHSVTVYAYSAAGWSASALKMSRNAADPPPPANPITNLHPGGRKSDCGNCYDILWSAPGVPNGSYTMKCYRGGRSGAFYTGGVSVSGGKRTSGYCSLDPNLSKKARIVLTGNGHTYDSGMKTWWP